MPCEQERRGIVPARGTAAGESTDAGNPPEFAADHLNRADRQVLSTGRISRENVDDPTGRRTARTRTPSAQPRRTRPHGERHPGARHGCGGAGEIRPSRPADGRGRYRDRAVHAVPQARSGRSEMAGPRPLRALGRPRLDADLRAALSARLRGDDDRRDQALPPARLAHARASGELHHARRRDHHRPARPGPRQRGRHGDRRAASRGRSSATSSITTPTCSPPTAT